MTRICYINHGAMSNTFDRVFVKHIVSFGKEVDEISECMPIKKVPHLRDLGMSTITTLLQH